MQYVGMRSNVHPKYKTRYRVGNWPAYERALVRRGDVTLWLSADAIDARKESRTRECVSSRDFAACASGVAGGPVSKNPPTWVSWLRFGEPVGRVGEA
jgi:hypothetical protein